MPNITSLPDEIIEAILQSIYNTGDEDLWKRETAFLNVVKVLPHWIPILLDSRFINDAGQLTTRYEEVWGYRHRVYLDPRSGLWQVRDRKWQPHGAKINGWKCRNGESSHIEVEEPEIICAGDLQNRKSAKSRAAETHGNGHEQPVSISRDNKRSRKASRKHWSLHDT